MLESDEARNLSQVLLTSQSTFFTSLCCVVSWKKKKKSAGPALRYIRLHKSLYLHRRLSALPPSLRVFSTWEPLLAWRLSLSCSSCQRRMPHSLLSVLVQSRVSQERSQRVPCGMVGGSAWRVDVLNSVLRLGQIPGTLSPWSLPLGQACPVLKETAGRSTGQRAKNSCPLCPAGSPLWAFLGKVSLNS